MGLAGLEPATPGTQNQNHTMLDYNPSDTSFCIPQLKDRFLFDLSHAQSVSIEDYKAAGKIAATVREEARNTDHDGKTVLEVCEHIESSIIKMGAKCAFPVNVSINETAAHYTAEPDDETIIGEGDLVKLDMGAQINGYIADTAVTVCTDPRHIALLDAAENALKTAMSMVAEDVKSKDVGRAIEKSIKNAGFKPIANLSGHSLDKYTIHAGRTIPNMWSIGSFSLEKDVAYACEPFLTYADGMGYVKEGKIKNIYAISNRKKTKDADADRMLEYIWDNYNMLPFAERWLRKEWDKTGDLLQFLVKKKCVRAYPVLIEANGKKVAQAEHTFIPQTGSAIVTTMAL